jgi:hypothetical protein
MSWSDTDILRALDMHERQGLTAAGVGRRMGRSRSAVLGMIHRINKDADRVACTCKRPENRDGGMPALWWAKGRTMRGR